MSLCAIAGLPCNKSLCLLLFVFFRILSLPLPLPLNLIIRLVLPSTVNSTFELGFATRTNQPVCRRSQCEDGQGRWLCWPRSLTSPSSSMQPWRNLEGDKMDWWMVMWVGGWSWHQMIIKTFKGARVGDNQRDNGYWVNSFYREKWSGEKKTNLLRWS